LRDVFVLVAAGALAAGFVAFLIGLLLARYRDIFFAMLSLAMSMILYGVLVKTETLGSTDGFHVEIALHIDVFIVQPRLIGRSLQRCQSHAFCLAGAIALRGQFQRALFDVLGKLLRLDGVINQPPLLCSLTANTIRVGAKHVGMIATHFTLVCHAS